MPEHPENPENPEHPENPDGAIQRIADRYPPADRRHRFAGIAILTVAVVLIGTWYLGNSARLAEPPVDGSIMTFEVVDDEHIDVTLLVVRPDPSRPAECTVMASDSSQQAVGELAVEVPPSDSGRETHKATLRTYQPAVNAHLKGCRLL